MVSLYNQNKIENNPDQEDEQKEENDVTTPKSVKQNENKDHNETSQVKVSKYDIKLDPKLNFSLGKALSFNKKFNFDEILSLVLNRRPVSVSSKSN